MKFFGFVLGALALVSGAIAVDIQKSVIITYKENTPDSVIREAKKAIVAAGGVITHEYTLMKYVFRTLSRALMSLLTL
ncbi:hypothetical protein QBC32DRAFT_335612 [Pseudoneurospora amorphoporcata]|uniref:Uncharacterized protein n=1 Tax=Pseudoneurospora amorphoporcata TaxID=241081 RepID=A0AAN6P0X9_9PEZI|nr:hypothetical protein QBC32DRAFT_335612 [Pseudoneurospora amorphoporcata]